jgi:hypothetical protein
MRFRFGERRRILRILFAVNQMTISDLSSMLFQRGFILGFSFGVLVTVIVLTPFDKDE